MASIFDSLTGAASQRAYEKNKQAIGATQNLSGDALTTAYGNAQGLLGTGSGATGNALGALSKAYDQSRGDLSGQYGQTQGFLGQIGDVYSGLAKSGQQATDARSDALGLNGAEGMARAKAAFTGSLGYGAGLDTGLDSVMRTASARGNLAGGNTSQDLFNYGADYQNKQSGAYIDRLTQAGQNYATGAAGQAAGLGLQGAASQSLGSGLSSLAQNFGQNSAGLYGLASNQQTQFGQGVAGIQQNAGNALVQNNSALAASQNQASANVLGGLLGGAQLLASPVGQNGATGTVGGSLLSSLANIFK